jgi:hypothetical protein
MAKPYEKLYTFVGTVDGELMGMQRGATLDDIKGLMACDSHGTTTDAGCWDCLDTETFLSELDANAQAIHTMHDGGRVYMSSAAYERLSE